MSCRVMIVDDSLFSQAEMRRMLEAAGIEVACVCRSGEEAVEAFPSVRPDVVTMDIVLPGMDGLAAAGLLMERWPGTAVLMVSSLAYEDTVQWAGEIGARGVLFKPFGQEELVEAIRGAVRTEEVQSGTGESRK